MTLGRIAPKYELLFKKIFGSGSKSDENSFFEELHTWLCSSYSIYLSASQLSFLQQYKIASRFDFMQLLLNCSNCGEQ